MPGRGKKGGAKAAGGTAGQSKQMTAWLSRGNSGVAAPVSSDVKMDEDVVAVEPVPEVVVVAKKAGRGGRKKSSPTKPEKAFDAIPISSESSMDGIDTTFKPSSVEALSKKIEKMQAKAAEPEMRLQSVGARTRGSSHRHLPVADPDTNEILKRYEVANLEEDDDLLREVLGGSPNAKTSAFSVSRATVTSPIGSAPKSKIAKLDIFEEKPDGTKGILPESSAPVDASPAPNATSPAPDAMIHEDEENNDKSPPIEMKANLARQYNSWATAKRYHKGDVMDALIMRHEADERYAARLASVLGEVEASSPSSSQGQGMDVDPPPPTVPRARVMVSLDKHEEVRDVSQEDTTFHLPFFSPPVVHPLPSHYVHSSPAIQVFAHSLSEEDLLYLPTGQNENFAMKADTQVPAYVETLNRFITQPNAIKKLPLLKYYLRRLGHVCPKHIVYWLLAIVCFSKHRETAFEAYDVLLSLHALPTGGAWPARIAKAGSTHVSHPSSAHFLSTAPKGRSMTDNAPVLVWNYPLLEVIFQTIFGAGSSTLSYIDILSQSAELRQATSEAAARDQKLRERLTKQLKKGVAQNNMIDRLEQHAEKHWESEQMAAAGQALQDAKKVELMKDKNLNSFNFSLFALLFAAALHSPSEICVDLDTQELIVCVNAIYRALVDASCQNIISDLEVLLRALLLRLFSQATPKQMPVVLQYLCESLWANLPAAEAEKPEDAFAAAFSHEEEPILGRSRYHSTLFRWCHLTPCSSPILKQVRSGMAWYFLRAMDASYSKHNAPKTSKSGPKTNLPLDESTSGAELGGPLEDPFVVPSAPQQTSPKGAKTQQKYKSAHAVVDLAQVTQFLNASKLPKIASPSEWTMYATWVLLIDIASASFDVSELSSLKKHLTQWDVAFTSWQRNAKEKSNLNLSMARFKDISTITVTKFRVINNSVQREPQDPFATFISPKKTAASASSSTDPAVAPAPDAEVPSPTKRAGRK